MAGCDETVVAPLLEVARPPTAARARANVTAERVAVERAPIDRMLIRWVSSMR